MHIVNVSSEPGQPPVYRLRRVDPGVASDQATLAGDLFGMIGDPKASPGLLGHPVLAHVVCGSLEGVEWCAAPSVLEHLARTDNTTGRRNQSGLPGIPGALRGALVNACLPVLASAQHPAVFSDPD